MADPKQTPSNQGASSAADADPRTVRRQVLRSGLAAAPVLMTLASRPVFAQSRLACFTPSGFVSLNASTTDRGVPCNGRTATYWINNTSIWPSPYTPATTFVSFFSNPPNPAYSGYPSTATLLDILKLAGTPPIDDVAQLLVAALLNATAGFTPFLPPQVIKHMWAEWSTQQRFTPSAGASWNHDELVGYLRITQAIALTL